MVERNWWAGDEYESSLDVGPCRTREEAITEAVGERIGEDERGWTFYVVQAESKPEPIFDWLDLERPTERASLAIFDSDRVHDTDDCVFAVSPEQEADLVRRLRAACDDWQAAHGLVFIPRTFTWWSEPEQVFVPFPEQQCAREC
jgi:hypothetical protein